MSTMAATRVELRIPPRAEFVAVARMAVKAVASRMPFGIDALEDIKLAVAEACTNAIEHATGGVGADAAIYIRCLLEPDQLVVEVQDCGGGAAGPVVGPGAEELPESGYGLLLIQALMDDLRWDTGTDGTTVTMVKRLSR
jgi:serine/threonine-protein kinase RsbW